MDEVQNIWRRHKLLIVLVAFFGIIYVYVGYVWFLLPDDKYRLNHGIKSLELMVSILGWATFFLKYHPVVFVPVLAVAGGITGLIVKYLITLKWPTKIVGIAILLALVFLNRFIGVFLYVFVIARW